MSTESRGVVRGPASRVESSPVATDSEDRTFSPTFILGAAHSGTTILYRMLALHPEVLWFSQFSLRSGEIAGRWSLPFNDPIDSALRQFTRHDWQKASSRRLQWIVPTPSEVRNVWKELLDRSGTTDERAAHVRWCVRSFCARRGGRHFVAKWPGFYRDIPVLSAAFPSARFVHIVRDGRPVALSVRHKFAGAQDEDASLVLAARYWVKEIEAVRAAAGSINLLEIRYEDLCRDVHGVLSRVLAHSMLHRYSYPFERTPRRLSSTNRSWTDRGARHELERIEEVQAALLSEYGYTDRRTSHPRDALGR